MTVLDQQLSYSKHKLAGGPGLEPGLAESESAVLLLQLPAVSRK